MIISCDKCGDKFERNISDVRKNKRRGYRNVCKNCHGGGKVSVKCNWCGNYFLKSRHRFRQSEKRNQKHYCRRCKNHRNGLVKGANVKTVFIQCAYCKEWILKPLYKVTANEKRGAKNMFCGYSCKGKFYMQPEQLEEQRLKKKEMEHESG